MHNWLLFPPVAFIIILFAVWVLSRMLSRLAFRSSAKRHKGTGEPYACGEEGYDPMAQPDYSTFFPFAFFFTLAHVATLIMTTVPVESLMTFILASIYIIGAVWGLYILFRR